MSYDSNHAVIFKGKVKNLSAVLDEITKFYNAKNINPNIYQAAADEGYFLENSENANRPIGMSYIHTAGDVCRFDYILVATEYRGKGVAHSILNALVEYCKNQKITNCFQWPANETSAKICEKAGFRHCKKIMAGRAGML